MLETEWIQSVQGKVHAESLRENELCLSFDQDYKYKDSFAGA
jgi:hypothetical protein